jgi:aminoglycoside/choline kinase family phosphotransferase
MEIARPWVEGSLRERIAEIVPLLGGAGARRYWRVRLEGGRSVVLMHALPEDPRILPPALRRTAPEAIPFLEVTGLLAAHGLPVPAIYAVERAQRWVLLEDLGDRHLLDLPAAEQGVWHERAIDLLARAHAIAPSEALPFRRSFDEEWVQFELRHFSEHALAATPRRALAPLLQELARRIARLPGVLCLRDYQSHNLMIDPAGNLRVIDYQDALMAPRELDLAALLHDSYLEIPEERRAALLARYAGRAGERPDPAVFAMLVVQRKCKDLGRYCFLVEEKGDRRYAPYRERARRSVLWGAQALAPGLRPLGRALEEALGEP